MFEVLTLLSKCFDALSLTFGIKLWNLLVFATWMQQMIHKIMTLLCFNGFCGMNLLLMMYTVHNCFRFQKHAPTPRYDISYDLSWKWYSASIRLFTHLPKHIRIQSSWKMSGPPHRSLGVLSYIHKHSVVNIPGSAAEWYSATCLHRHTLHH